MFNHFFWFVASNSSIASLNTTHLHLVMKLDDLDVKLCCHEQEFAAIQVKGILILF